MARHGENIRKRKDGRWEGRYKKYCCERETYIYHSVYGRSYEEVRKSRKPSTYQKYRLVYQKYLVDEFGNMALLKITGQSVEQKISDGLSRSIRESIYCVLNRVLKYVYEKYSVALSAIRKPF